MHGVCEEGTFKPCKKIEAVVSYKLVQDICSHVLSIVEVVSECLGAVEWSCTTALNNVPLTKHRGRNFPD